MPRLAYVNGCYLPHLDAAVHIDDRGYQFADGVYEVIPVFGGALIDEGPHLDRLERSLAELRIAMPQNRAALRLLVRELLRRNKITRGTIYIQVTRGVAPRDHKFPQDTKPTLVMTTRQVRPHDPKMVAEGVKVITIADQRWARVDIKSISLLPNLLGKQRAAEAGAFEAWQVDGQGYVTEGTSSNAWIVTEDGCVLTRSASNAILNGITRQTLLRLIEKEGFQFEERAFSESEAKTAREAFLTSSSSYLMPVSQIDEVVIGNGHAGFLSGKLRQAYLDYLSGHPVCE